MSEIQQPSYQSLLITMMFNGQPLSTGTAFVVNKGRHFFLITNRHNVTGRNQHDNKPLSSTGGIPNNIIIWHNVEGDINELRWEGKVENILNDDGEPLWYEHPYLGPKADFVALKLNNLERVILYPYNLNGMGNAVGIQAQVSLIPGNPVSVVGFPFGLQAGGSLAIWATGFIASDLIVDYTDLPIFLIDCRARQGQSGSAVIFNSEKGIPVGGGTISNGKPFTMLLGIYSGRINSESDLGIVWKTTAIKELIDSIEI